MVGSSPLNSRRAAARDAATALRSANGSDVGERGVARDGGEGAGLDGDAFIGRMPSGSGRALRASNIGYMCIIIIVVVVGGLDVDGTS